MTKICIRLRMNRLYRKWKINNGVIINWFTIMRNIIWLKHVYLSDIELERAVNNDFGNQNVWLFYFAQIMGGGEM